MVTAGASGRMKLHGQLIWESSSGGLGRLMVSNLQAELEHREFSDGGRRRSDAADAV